jgi:hypothetical protein
VRAALAVLLFVGAACGPRLPRAPRAAQPEAAFHDVPYPPPPPHAERVPERPSEPAVWVDGSWEWSGTRWRWVDGGWFERPPDGVFRSEWALTRDCGTRLSYATAAWRDAHGNAVPGPRRLASAATTELATDGGPSEATDAGIASEGGELDAGS